MSHEIVKSIAIKDDKVYLTGADSSLRPLSFNRFECTPLSNLLAEKGPDALYAKIGEEMWNGNMEVWSGSKLCKLYLAARNAFPTGMNFATFDSKTAGEFLGRMVKELERDPPSDLSDYVKQALALQNNRDYILEAAQRTGYNFLNYASPELQTDKAFALEVLRAGHGAAWFSYPTQFNDDKEFALEALRLNGCFYRELDENLMVDKEVIREAFREAPNKKFHEHIPTLIPPMALFDYETDPTKPTLNKAFIMELLDVCPSMHMNRAPLLLEDRDIALKWSQVGKFFPYSVGDLPEHYLAEKEFQDTLCKRFEGTEQYDILLKRFAEKGIPLGEKTLDAKIQSAVSRTVEVSCDGKTASKETPKCR